MIIAGVFTFSLVVYSSLEYSNPRETTQIANQIAAQNQVNPSNLKLEAKPMHL